MNPFQEMCVQACQKCVEENLNISVGFEEVKGKTENYLVGKIHQGGHLLEIYVYIDEAGFMLDGSDWTICERPDFDSPQELCEKFVRKLQDCLRNDRFGGKK